MERSSTAIAYQNYVESFIKKNISERQHQIVKIETIFNLLHLRTSDDYFGKGYKNESQMMLEGLISCLGGKKLEGKYKIKGKNLKNNQILTLGDDSAIPVSLTEFCRLKKSYE